MITIVGSASFLLASAGSVTSTSSGAPSKLGTRSASVRVGQKRTPFCGSQGCPNGAGGAAWAPAGASRLAPTTNASAAVLRIAGALFPVPWRLKPSGGGLRKHGERDQRRAPSTPGTYRTSPGPLKAST